MRVNSSSLKATLVIDPQIRFNKIHIACPFAFFSKCPLQLHSSTAGGCVFSRTPLKLFNWWPPLWVSQLVPLPHSWSHTRTRRGTCCRRSRVWSPHHHVAPWWWYTPPHRRRDPSAKPHSRTAGPRSDSPRASPQSTTRTCHEALARLSCGTVSKSHPIIIINNHCEIESKTYT